MSPSLASQAPSPSWFGSPPAPRAIAESRPHKAKVRAPIPAGHYSARMVADALCAGHEWARAPISARRDRRHRRHRGGMLRISGASLDIAEFQPHPARCASHSWPRPSRPAALVLLTLALALTLTLAGCGAPAAAVPAATPTPPATIPLPPMLGAYHVFTADLLTGDVVSLGAQTVNVARSVHGLGLSSDGKWLYVTDVSGNRLVAYRIQGGRLTDERSAPVGAYPVHMVETHDQRFIFVTNFYGASVSVVSTQTWRAVKTITTPRSPHGIVLSPDGRYAYVACYLGHAIAVLDVATQSLVATIPFPAQAHPYGLAISSDGRYVYASDNFSGRLYVIDTATRRLITGVPVGQNPSLIARSPDGRTLYVANGASRSVSVLDIGANPAAPRVIATIPVSGYPHGLAVTPDGRYVVVADTSSGQLSIIDTLTNQVIATVSGLRYPNDAITTAA